MFNLLLVLILVVISIPGILLLIPAIKNIYKSAKNRMLTNKKLPSEKVFIIVSIAQNLVFVTIAAFIGTFLSNKTNLHAPFFEAIINRHNPWDALLTQIFPSVIVGGFGALIFLIIYYSFFRSFIDEKTIEGMEKLRTSVGICGRVLYGGIVEEILCRWGLLSLLVWMGILVFGKPTPFIMWTAILISGFLFAIGHLPAYISFGCKKTPRFIISTVLLNLWAATIFGWLFWKYGLDSAIIAHIIFHSIWYPFDLFFITVNLNSINSRSE